MTCVLRSYDVRSDNFETKTFASKLEGIFATLESRTSRPWQEMDSHCYSVTSNEQFQ